MIKNIFLLIIIFIVSSCSDEQGKKVVFVKNKNQPANLKTNFKLKKLEEIDFYDKNDLFNIGNINRIAVDSKKCFYLLDTKNCHILKFDSNNVFQKSFLRKGIGPGEVKFTWNMTIVDDTILVDNPALQTILAFNSNGNFLKTIKVKESIENFKATSNQNIIGFASKEVVENGNYYSYYDLTIFNSSFAAKKVLVHNKTKIDDNFNFLDQQEIKYCLGNQQIYLAHNSENSYQVDIFDKNGNLQKQLKKSFSKIKYSDEEWELFRSRYQNKLLFINNKSRYKKAIKKISIDKKGNLWIFPSFKGDGLELDSLIVDVFNKDNLFTNKFSLKFSGQNFSEGDLYLLLNKIFLVNKEEQKLEIYDYQY